LTALAEKIDDPRAAQTAGGLADTYVGGTDVTKAIDRFTAKYEVDPETGCWLWTGALKPNGYGVFGVGGRQGGNTYAHRAAYEFFVGPIPPDLLVLHRCDTPPCVNPAHLFLGSHADNMADMTAKGRSLRGERHNRGKLTEADAVEIRQLWSDGGMSQSEIGRRFGIGKTTVSAIVRGYLWRHLLPDDWIPPATNRWSR
jgi:hypothetical protein